MKKIVSMMLCMMIVVSCVFANAENNTISSFTTTITDSYNYSIKEWMSSKDRQLLLCKSLLSDMFNADLGLSQSDFSPTSGVEYIVLDYSLAIMAAFWVKHSLMVLVYLPTKHSAGFSYIVEGSLVSEETYKLYVGLILLGKDSDFAKNDKYHLDDFSSALFDDSRQNMWICPKCGEEWTEKTRFCENCGNQRPTVKPKDDESVYLGSYLSNIFESSYSNGHRSAGYYSLPYNTDPSISFAFGTKTLIIINGQFSGKEFTNVYDDAAYAAKVWIELDEEIIAKYLHFVTQLWIDSKNDERLKNFSLTGLGDGYFSNSVIDSIDKAKTFLIQLEKYFPECRSYT